MIAGNPKSESLSIFMEFSPRTLRSRRRPEMATRESKVGDTARLNFDFLGGKSTFTLSASLWQDVRGLIKMFAVPLAAALTLQLLLTPSSFQGRNSIEGRVTTPDHKGVENVHVFLLNDSYGERGQTYTDGSGRYQFRGLGTGNYYVQVDPAGTTYEKQTQRVEVNPFDPSGSGGAEIFRLDIVLRLDKSANSKSGIAEGQPGSAGVLFAQEVPASAKAAYERGAESLKKEDLKNAELELTHAIQIFPDYYDALDMLGVEYVKHGFYDSALPLLAHSVEINKNSWHSYYGLGVSLLELGRRSEGLDALRQAVKLNPKSVNASMRLGLELAKDDQHADEALKLLLEVTQMAGKQLPDAYLALASLYSKKEEFHEAADALEHYLQAMPESANREGVKQKIEELRHKAGKPKSASKSTN